MFLVFFLDVVNVLLFLGFRNLSQREKPLIELIDFFGCQTVRLCFFIFKKFGKAVVCDNVNVFTFNRDLFQVRT